MTDNAQASRARASRIDTPIVAVHARWPVVGTRIRSRKVHGV
ncbi:hypothetical protein V1291_004781 [Nitrobacteraceae bacterium AZCC 1564]